MKTISLLQPWASLIAVGAKRIETRSWATKHRGPIAIHASARMTPATRSLCYQRPFKNALIDGLKLRPHTPHLYPLEEKDVEDIDKKLPLGAVLATAKLIDCIPTSRLTDISDDERAFGDYGLGRYGWILRDIVALPEPVPAKGCLYLWNWEPPK